MYIDGNNIIDWWGDDHQVSFGWWSKISIFLYFFNIFLICAYLRNTIDLLLIHLYYLLVKYLPLEAGPSKGGGVTGKSYPKCRERGRDLEDVGDGASGTVLFMLSQVLPWLFPPQVPHTLRAALFGGQFSARTERLINSISWHNTYLSQKYFIDFWILMPHA